MLRSTWLLLFISCFHFLKAQNFGGNPSALKWNKITTSQFNLIYPKGYDSSAMRIANVLTNELQYNLATIGNKIKKVDMFLQTQTTLSNGYVMLGPWRSEFYTTPNQNAFELSGLQWTDLLSIHEYRHVEQYSNLQNGLSKVAAAVFGDYGQAIANGASVPDWFFEGDAVYNETMMSEQGRGRLPMFFNGFKSLYYSNRQYNYMKLRNGSYKNYVPNHYQLGYLLVAYGREKYGDDFWKNVTHDASSFKPLLYPMQGAVKYYSGKYFNTFVDDAFKYYQQQWSNDYHQNINYITPLKRIAVVNEKYPYQTKNSSIISYYNDSRHVGYFKNDNRKIAVRDIDNDDYFSYNNNNIIYSSYKPHARWANKEFSEIRLINTTTGQRKKITSKTRYFSPDISHSGTTIAAVEIDDDDENFLVILDANGNLINKTKACSRCTFSYPKFSQDDKQIFVVQRNAHGKMGIMQFDINTQSVSTLLPFSKRIIGFPVVQNDTLLYSCSNNGNDEIWAYTISNKQSNRLATMPTGLYQAVIKSNKLVTSNFTADGYRLAEIDAAWHDVNNASDTLKDLYVQRPFGSAINNFLQQVPNQLFPVTPFHKASHPFNFHSRSPYADGSDYSLIFYGENAFNTFQHQLYYAYNTNEHFHRVGYTAIYGGWYVEPFIDVQKTWDRNYTNIDSLLTGERLFYNENNIAAGLQLPLNFTGGLMYRYLTISAAVRHKKFMYTGEAKSIYNDYAFNYGEYKISYNQSVQQATQQIYPHIAQSFLLQFRHGASAHQLLASGNFYFPGFAPAHSIVLNTAFQFRDTSGAYYFDNNFNFSRGYSKADYPRMWKLGVNYHFPLWYPDAGFGNVLYILRIRANTFFDYTQVKSLRYQTHYNFKSTGAEIFFDTKWWNTQPLSFGIRYSYLLNDHNKSKIDFVVPILF